MHSSNSQCEIAEDLLAAAGIKFVVVDRCPHEACEVCAHESFSAAA